MRRVATLDVHGPDLEFMLVALEIGNRNLFVCKYSKIWPFFCCCLKQIVFHVWSSLKPFFGQFLGEGSWLATLACTCGLRYSLKSSTTSSRKRRRRRRHLLPPSFSLLVGGGGGVKNDRLPENFSRIFFSVQREKFFPDDAFDHRSTFLFLSILGRGGGERKFLLLSCF